MEGEFELRKKKEEWFHDVCSVEKVFVISMLIILAVTFVGTMVFSSFEGIVIGIILFIVAISFYFIAKKKKDSYYWVSIILNSIACGFVISAYYLCDEKEFGLLSIVAMVLVCALMFGLMLIFYGFQKHPKLAFLIDFLLTLAVLVLCVIGWSKYSAALLPFIFFLTIQILIYLFALRYKEEKGIMLLKSLSFGSFGVFLIVLFAVLTILSEGDTLDIFDVDFTESSKKRKSF